MRKRARLSLRTALVTLVVGLLMQGNAYAEGQTSARFDFAHGAAVGFDLVILRPLGLAAVVVSAAFFVPAAILTAPNGRDGLGEGLEQFVNAPAYGVFRRPLGDF